MDRGVPPHGIRCLPGGHRTGAIAPRAYRPTPQPRIRPPRQRARLSHRRCRCSRAGWLIRRLRDPCERQHEPLQYRAGPRRYSSRWRAWRASRRPWTSCRRRASTRPSRRDCARRTVASSSTRMPSRSGVASGADPPPYRLEVVPSAGRDLDQLPEKIAVACVEFIFTTLAANPHRVSKALVRELAGQHSARRGAYATARGQDRSATQRVSHRQCSRTVRRARGRRRRTAP